MTFEHYGSWKSKIHWTETETRKLHDAYKDGLLEAMHICTEIERYFCSQAVEASENSDSKKSSQLYEQSHVAKQCGDAINKRLSEEHQRPDGYF